MVSVLFSSCPRHRQHASFFLRYSRVGRRSRGLFSVLKLPPSVLKLCFGVAAIMLACLRSVQRGRALCSMTVFSLAICCPAVLRSGQRTLVLSSSPAVLLASLLLYRRFLVPSTALTPCQFFCALSSPARLFQRSHLVHPSWFHERASTGADYDKGTIADAAGA